MLSITLTTGPPILVVGLALVVSSTINPLSASPPSTPAKGEVKIAPMSLGPPETAPPQVAIVDSNPAACALDDFIIPNAVIPQGEADMKAYWNQRLSSTSVSIRVSTRVQSWGAVLSADVRIGEITNVPQFPNTS